MKIFQWLLGINWRTTLGALAPLLTSIGIIATDIGKGEWPSHQDEAVVFSFLSIGWGLIMAKDRVVTGGSVSNVDGTVAPITVSLINKPPQGASNG
jgi:hypothetical protein